MAIAKTQITGNVECANYQLFANTAAIKGDNNTAT